MDSTAIGQGLPNAPRGNLLAGATTGFPTDAPPPAGPQKGRRLARTVNGPPMARKRNLPPARAGGLVYFFLGESIITI